MFPKISRSESRSLPTLLELFNALAFPNRLAIELASVRLADSQIDAFPKINLRCAVSTAAM
jgi:hypothetical protein